MNNGPVSFCLAGIDDNLETFILYDVFHDQLISFNVDYFLISLYN